MTEQPVQERGELIERLIRFRDSQADQPTRDMLADAINLLEPDPSPVEAARR